MRRIFVLMISLVFCAFCVMPCSANSEYISSAAELLLGDVDADGDTDTDDAVYLLLHVMFGNADYPIENGTVADMDGNAVTDTDDAVYLLLHVMFGGEDYPLLGDNAVVPATMALKQHGVLPYYLYTPQNPVADMPLIIYLHGGTNKREDVTALLTTEGFPKFLNDGDFGDLRAYVAVPKLEDSYKGWADIYEQIRDLVKFLAENYGVDRSRVALTGHSMGGTGTFQLQTKLPNTFACIAPLSGSIKNSESNLTALSKTKVWAFVAEEDTVVDPESSKEIVRLLKDRGASAQITELKNATHFTVPEQAYKNSDLIAWLVNCGN